MRATAIKRLKQGHTIWIVRRASPSEPWLEYVCKKYLVMSSGYERAPVKTIDFKMNINKAMELITYSEDMEIKIFRSGKKAINHMRSLNAQ